MEVSQPALYKLLVDVPFPTKRYAQIVYDVLRVDAEPKRSKVTKNITLEGNVIKAQFFSFDIKNLRVGINSFLEHMLLATETIECFGPPHTPAPTPARSIYGFVMYLSFQTLFAIYLCWALIPDRWLNAMNIYYYPQKYWAVAVPVQLLVALTLFAFFVYPGLNLAMTPDVADLRTITDNFALKKRQLTAADAEGTWCDCRKKSLCHFNSIARRKKKGKRIPHVEDLDIIDICKELYLK